MGFFCCCYFFKNHISTPRYMISLGSNVTSGTSEQARERAASLRSAVTLHPWSLGRVVRPSHPVPGRNSHCPQRCSGPGQVSCSSSRDSDITLVSRRL